MSEREDDRLAVFAWLVAAATLAHFWNQVDVPNLLGELRPDTPFFHPNKLKVSEQG